MGRIQSGPHIYNIIQFCRDSFLNGVPSQPVYPLRMKKHGTPLLDAQPLLNLLLTRASSRKHDLFGPDELVLRLSLNYIILLSTGTSSINMSCESSASFAFLISPQSLSLCGVRNSSRDLLTVIQALFTSFSIDGMGYCKSVNQPFSIIFIFSFVCT